MKTLNAAFYVIFILLLLGVAGLFLTSLLPIPGNIQIKIVKSGSMAPAIPTGSIVIVKPAASYAVGDVITFGEDTGKQIPTTHRVVEVQSEGWQVFYMTKGDANEEADNVRIAHGDVIGSVIFTAPYAGYVLDFARKPLGFTFMIGVPAGIIILDEMIRIVKEVQRMWGKKREDENETPLQKNISAGAQGYDFDPSLIRRSIDGIRPRSLHAYE